MNSVPCTINFAQKTHHNDAAPFAMREIQRLADEEQRTITQICETLLRHDGVEAYKKEDSKFT